MLEGNHARAELAGDQRHVDHAVDVVLPGAGDVVRTRAEELRLERVRIRAVGEQLDGAEAEDRDVPVVAHRASAVRRPPRLGAVLDDGGPDAQPRLILNALSTITNVKVLSSPSLVVVNNQPAVLQVGDQIPLTTSTATLLSNSNAPVVNTIEMRNTGVILKVLPQVNSNGTILLEIEQEISNVLNQDQQSLTPSISQRRVHSTVAVTSGQTVLLGGLISERDEKTLSGIPGLRQIEFLGNLQFARKRPTPLYYYRELQNLRDPLHFTDRPR